MSHENSHKKASLSHPLVSVVMPSYNTSEFICEAIDSVLTQEYPNLELIVVDDGSTDNTAEIIRTRYAQRVTLTVQANQGAAAARNAGIELSRGEFITFIDSDDLWLTNKVGEQVRYLQQNPTIDLVFSRWHVWKPDHLGHFIAPDDLTNLKTDEFTTDETIPVVRDRSGWLYNRLLLGSALHTITVMARRTLLERVGPFDVELKRGQDYDYWLRASRFTEIHQLDRVHALYRVHGNGCIRKWPAQNYERLVLERNLSRWGNIGPDGTSTPHTVIRKRLSQVCFDFGYHHLKEGDPRIAMSQFKDAIRFNPKRLSLWKFLFLSTFVAIRKIRSSP